MPCRVQPATPVPSFYFARRYAVKSATMVPPPPPPTSCHAGTSSRILVAARVTSGEITPNAAIGRRRASLSGLDVILTRARKAQRRDARRAYGARARSAGRSLAAHGPALPFRCASLPPCAGIDAGFIIAFGAAAHIPACHQQLR